MPDKRPDPPENEISWRTEELGPEMRRRLFEKLFPSARSGTHRDGPVPVLGSKDTKERSREERPKAPKAPKSGHK